MGEVTHRMHKLTQTIFRYNEWCDMVFKIHTPWWWWINTCVSEISYGELKFSEIKFVCIPSQVSRFQFSRPSAFHINAKTCRMYSILIGLLHLPTSCCHDISIICLALPMFALERNVPFNRQIIFCSEIPLHLIFGLKII